MITLIGSVCRGQRNLYTSIELGFSTKAIAVQ